MSNTTPDDDELQRQREHAVLKLVQAIMEEPSEEQEQRRASESEGAISVPPLFSSSSSSTTMHKTNPMTTPPAHFADLYDGAKLYSVLTKVDAAIFSSTSQVEDMSRFSDKNTVLRKSIFQIVIREMNHYAKAYLFPAAHSGSASGGPASLSRDWNTLFDVQKLALMRKPDVGVTSANTSCTNAPSASGIDDRVGRDLFFKLCEWFVVIVVMSGEKPLLDKVRQLAKDTQLCLSNMAKQIIKVYQLEPRKPHRAAVPQHPLAGRDSNAASMSGESLSIMGGTTGPSSPTEPGAAPHAASHTATEEPQPYPPLVPTSASVAGGLPATPVGPEDSTNSNSVDHEGKGSQDMPSMRPSTRAPSQSSMLLPAAGLPAPLPLPAFSAAATTADDKEGEEGRGRRKSHSMNGDNRTTTTTSSRPPTWQPQTAEALLAPDAYMLTHLRQLEEQVRTLTAQKERQETALRTVTDEKEKWRVRYQYLLEQQEKRQVGRSAVREDSSEGQGHPATSADDAVVAEGIEEDMAFTSVDFQKRLQAKENLNEVLRRRCAEQERTIGQLREEALKAEETVATLKRKVKNTEESLIMRSEEKRDALAKLSVVEDKLLIQIRAKTEMENELEEVRAQLTIVEMRMRDREYGVGVRGGGTDAGEAKDDDDDDVSSTDHIVVLEQQLNAVQTERDTLYKRVRELAVLSQQQYQLLQANHLQLAHLNAKESAQLMEELSALTASPSPLKRREERDGEEGDSLVNSTPDRSEIMPLPGSVGAATAADTPVLPTAAAAATTGAAPLPPSTPTPVSNLSALFTNNTTMLQNASTMSQVVAQHDTWKAQLRQLEREKEELRVQLARAQASLVSLSEQQQQSNAEEKAAPATATTVDATNTNTGKTIVHQDTKRYQAVLTCLLLRANYRNTLLQQHAALLASSSSSSSSGGSGSSGAAAGAAHSNRTGDDTPPPPSGGGTTSTTCSNSAASSSSFITRQRREIERGLLDSVIHNKPPPTFFEHSARQQ